MPAPVKKGAILASAGGASDPPEPASKDAVRTLNKFIKFAHRLPSCRLIISQRFASQKSPEESMCARTAVVLTASVLFCVRSTVHNEPSAADRSANAGREKPTFRFLRVQPTVGGLFLPPSGFYIGRYDISS